MQTGKFYSYPSAMEPMLPSKIDDLKDISREIEIKSAKLTSTLQAQTCHSIANLLRQINCYYSNLIEGHNTYPIDIEHALSGDYSKEPTQRALQLESKAHIEVQELLQQRFIQEADLNVTNLEFIGWIHKEFYKRMPNEYKVMQNHQTGKKIEIQAGQLRNHEVQVGQHIPPTHAALEIFMQRFAQAYQIEKLTHENKLIAIAASHHRLTWIHPFSDGNGRVTRLLTDAMFTKIKLEGHGMWPINRGFARHKDEYLQALISADARRQNDYDGRGNLSEKGLAMFCQYFLEVCLDQIEFMQHLLALDKLQDRIMGYIRLRTTHTNEENPKLKIEAAYLLREALLRGAVPRGEVPRITGMAERTARNLVSQLLKEKLLLSETSRSPLRLGFPAKTMGYYFPELYPAGTIPLI